MADGSYQSHSPRSNVARGAKSGNFSQDSDATGSIQQHSEHVEQEIEKCAGKHRPRHRQEGGQQNVQRDEPVGKRDEHEKNARAVTGVLVAQAEHDDAEDQLKQCENASDACQERCIHRQGNYWRRTGRCHCGGLANSSCAGRHRAGLEGEPGMLRKLGEREL